MKKLIPEDIQRHLELLFESECTTFPEDLGGGRLWEKPFTGVADAEDPFFLQLKKAIGDFYWTPGDILGKARPGSKARSVIVWCLPASETARRANRKESTYPSREWAWTRTYGEYVNDRLREGMVTYLEQAGFSATAPHLHPDNEVDHRPGPGWSCNWSERHAAFVAGLGTFGISGGLITRKGIAHRLGSVVTNCELEPTIRPYGDDPFAWCLRTAKGACGVCIERCPVGSIGETVEDRKKDLCATHDMETIPAAMADVFGWEGEYGCGLCQTKVPCEAGIPRGLQ